MKKALILIVMVLFLGLAFYWTETGPKKGGEDNVTVIVVRI